MAEIKKTFADFQESQCPPSERVSFEEKKLCDTCIPNPNWKLGQFWYNMGKNAWLDEKTCEYKIVIQPTSTGIYTDQDVIREACLLLLQQNDKKTSKEMYCAFSDCASTNSVLEEHKKAILDFREKIRNFGGVSGVSVATESNLGAAFGYIPQGGVGPMVQRGLINGLTEKERLDAFGLEHNSIVVDEMRVYIREYFGSDLFDQLDTLEQATFQAGGANVHPYALEWTARIADTYVDWRTSKVDPKKYLVAIPAYDLDVIPDDLQDVSDETEEDAYSQDTIIVDGPNLGSRLFKIKVALNAYAIYYSAFQRIDNLLIRQSTSTIGEDPELYRFSYGQVISEITEFQSILNDILSDQGYERISIWNFPTFGIREEVGKIKFELNTEDELPYNFKKTDSGKPKVYVKSRSGCGDYELLSHPRVIELEKYKTVLGFLANLKEMIIDITALEAKPWLEFTLEYHYPPLIADYGLNSGQATEEQKHALACFLEEELGLGNGKLIDSVVSQIISVFDLYTFEMKNNACRSTEELEEKGNVAEKEKKNREERKNEREEQRRNQMVERYKKQIYNQRLAGYKNQLAAEWENGKYQQYYATEKEIEQASIDADNAYAEENYAEQDRYLSKVNDLEQELSTLEQPKEPTDEDLLEFYGPDVLKNQEALAQFEAEKKYDDKEGKKGAALTNSPFWNDAAEALKETFLKEKEIIDELRENISDLGDIETLNDFLAIFGICGVSKIAGKALECLMGGLTLEQVMDAAIRKIFEYMEVEVFQVFFNNLPADIRRKLDAQIKKDFGSDVDLVGLLGFMGEQNPNANLRAVSGEMMQTIEDIESLIREYESPDWAFRAGKKEELVKLFGADSKSANGGSSWKADIDIDFNPLYSWELGDYRGSTDKEKKQNQRELRRGIRDFLRNRDKEQFDAAKERYKSLIKPQQAAHQVGLEYLESLLAPIEAEIESTNARIQEITAQTWEQKYLSEEARKLFESSGDTIAKAVMDDAVAKMQGLDKQRVEAERYLEELKAEKARTKSNQGLGTKPDLTTTEHLQYWSDREEAIQSARNERQKARAEITNLVNDKLSLSSNQYEQAVKDYEETNIGVKINKFLGAVIVTTVESLFDFTPSTNIFDMLKQFPIPDVVVNALESLLAPCPHTPMFFPPPAKFMNSLKVDFCDPTLQVRWPKFVMPSIDWRYQLKEAAREQTRKLLEEMFKKTVLKILKKIMETLSEAVCKSLEAIGAFAAATVTGERGIEDNWYEAIDKAFCGEDPDHSKASAINQALFGQHANKAANIISGIASQDELLNALTGADQDGDFNTRLANAINSLAPELETLLGSPAKVGYWFDKVGSFLHPDDKARIQDILGDQVPNLPISSAICLTNEQLDEWDKLREALLREKGLSPEDARRQIKNLNDLTEEALRDLLDSKIALETPGGPFLADIQNSYPPYDDGIGQQIPDDGSIDDVYNDTDEPCDDNPFRNAQSQFEKEEEEQDIEEETETLNRIIKQGFLGRKGIFQDALRDTNDKKLFFHSLRVKSTYLWPNYANDESEHAIKFNESEGSYLQFAMAVASGDLKGTPEPNGVFPKTVAGKMMEDATKRSNFNYNKDAEYSESFVYSDYDPPGTMLTKLKDVKDTQSDNDESDTHNFSLKMTIDTLGNNDIKRRKQAFFETATNLTYKVNPGLFDYYVSTTNKVSKEGARQTQFSTTIPVDLTEEEELALVDVGFNYGAERTEDTRRDSFNALLNSDHELILGTQNYDNLYYKCFEEFTSKTIKQLFKSPDGDTPYGFKFGYIPENLTEDDFVYKNPEGGDYNKREKQKILGKYDNDRIVVLNPEVYGGRYSNPPIHIKPMPQDGWLDATRSLFGGVEGCEPKTPAALEFGDISDRVKKLAKILTPDPRLSKNPDCVAVRPFNHLLLHKTHAALDGVVRTTLRTYVAEYFLLGLGVYSNLQYNEDNYGPASAMYIAQKMKEDMSELGFATRGSRIRIKREKYWITFLEQCVQVYQRMIDVDGLKPPPEIQNALDVISEVQQNYVYPTKKLMRKHLRWADYDFVLPGAELAPSHILDLKYFYHAACAYVIYGENMFKSNQAVRIPWKRRFRLKKIRFFTKVLAIRIVEKQCLMIMSELIRSEMRILTKKYSSTMDKQPPIQNMLKYVIGNKELFPTSNSNIGTLKYDLTGDTGDIPEVSENNVSAPINPDPPEIPLINDPVARAEALAERAEAIAMAAITPTFVVEKYIRLEDSPTLEKIQLDGSSKPVPDFIVNRAEEYRGIIPLTKFDQLKDIAPGSLEDLKISDCFGDMRFLFKRNIRKFLRQGEAMQIGLVDKLIQLNPDLSEDIKNAEAQYYLGNKVPSLELSVTRDLLGDNDSLEPSGVTGKIGVYHGIRISVVPPMGSITPEVTSELQRISNHSKAYLFQDGKVMIPLITEEVEVIDGDLVSFSAVRTYDLECMVNKLMANPRYSLIFDKMFGLTMMSSMAAVYCMHGWKPSLGYGEEERNFKQMDPADPEDDGDFFYAKRAKKMLRRQFAGLYLSNDSDGARPDKEDREGRIRFDNPLDEISLSFLLPKIPWFQRRRIISNPYDKNGEECANPLKDLM